MSEPVRTKHKENEIKNKARKERVKENAENVTLIEGVFWSENEWWCSSTSCSRCSRVTSHQLYRICLQEEVKEEAAEESSAAPGEEGEGDSEKPATDEENSAMREKMIFGRKKVRKSFRVSPTQGCQMAKFDPFEHEAVWELIYESTINLYLWRTLQNTYMYYIYILHCHSTFLTHDFFCWHLEWSINNLR